MKVIICDDYEDLSEKTAEFIEDYINKKPAAVFCPTAGDTPAGTYKKLVEYSSDGRIDFDKTRFVGLDEWVGMDESIEGSCKNFVYENLFNPLEVSPSNIVFFDARAKDLDAECRKIDSYISEEGPIDLMLVGLGMNGHIGLNEPGTSFDTYSQVVDLSPTTKKVGQKYFKDQTALEKGITLGLKHLMEAECAVIIASGTKKAEIIKRVVEGKVTEEVPGTILQLHKNGYLFIDREAASLLDKAAE